MLGPEGQRAYARVRAVRADQQIRRALRAVGEGERDLVAVLVDGLDGGAVLDGGPDLVSDGTGEIAAQQVTTSRNVGGRVNRLVWRPSWLT